MLSTPLHPLIVHFPIAFLSIGAIVLIISTWKKGLIAKAGTWLIGFGFVTAIVAFLTGDGAEEYARQKHTYNHSMVEIHQAFGLTTIIVFGLVLALQIFNYYKPMKIIPYINLCLAVLGLVMITLTGHYGGRMVYQ